MRTVPAKSLAVGTTVLSSTVGAFKPCSKVPASTLTLSAVPSSDLPPPETTMAPLLADPSTVLGRQKQQFVAKTPELLDNNTGFDKITKAQLVPPSKSLRTRLNLPAAHPVFSTTTSRPRIVGHRGSVYEELENTRPAFLACAGICDAVELDVFELKDGTLVVFHGSGNDRNPGLLKDYCTSSNTGAKSILDLTYEETQQLTFNPSSAELVAPDDKVRQGQIPTLEQVLTDLKPTGMEVKIELKGKGTARPVVELVDRLGMAHQVSFSSFNHQEIQTVREMRPQTKPDGAFVYKTGALFNEVPADFIQQAQAVQASEVHLRYDTCTTDRVEAIHGAGMGSMAWMRGPVGMKSDVTNKWWDIGNEDTTCLEAMVETGVQQLCVNKPKVLYDLLQSKQQEATAMPLAAHSA